MSNIQYILLSDNDEQRVDMDGNYSFFDMADVTSAAYKLYQNGFGLAGVVAIDIKTGKVFQPECIDREGLKSLMYHLEQTERREEAEVARYGSYFDQHRLRLLDVVA